MEQDLTVKVLMYIDLDTSVQDAAWYYADPFEKALNIKDHIAFCGSISNIA